MSTLPPPNPFRPPEQPDVREPYGAPVPPAPTPPGYAVSAPPGYAGSALPGYTGSAPSPPRAGAPAWATCTALALAALGVVLGGAALVAALVSGLGGPGGALSSDGEVPGVSAGSPVFGPTIATAVASLIRSDMVDVGPIECGSVAALEKDSTVTCRGTVGDWEGWEGFVRFTGDGGAFELIEP